MKGKVSTVLPAFNEVHNIEPLTRLAVAYLPTLFDACEVIIVDDGSSDGTGILADQLAVELSSVVAVHHPVNRGYGASLRSGFAAATGDYVFFTDGDGQFDLRQLPRLVDLITGGADIACGYRIRRADPAVRRLNAELYNVAVRLLFGLAVKDIDCAFKLFRREVLQEMELTSTGAFVNAEFLIRARQKGWEVRETGVDHLPRRRGRQSGNNPLVVLRAFKELAAFWCGLRMRE